jgi:CheY-like chemotaxis protein
MLRASRGVNPSGGRALDMENLFSFSKVPDLSLILASGSESEQFNIRKKGKKKHSSAGRKTGNRVLIVGRQRELALYRAEFLRQAGFLVMNAEDEEAAIRSMQHGKFDAVVLSYTIGNEVAQYLANMARDYCEDCPIISIANSSDLDGRIAPDAVAFAEEGPAGLVSALKQVLEVD